MMSIIKEFIPKIFKYLDKKSDQLADLIISKPIEDENKPSEQTTIEYVVNAGVSSGVAYAITAGAISATETLASYGAANAIVQGSATVASAGVSMLTSPLSAVGTIASTESLPLAVATGAVMFFSYTSGKIAARAAGHAYNYLAADTKEKIAPFNN